GTTTVAEVHRAIRVGRHELEVDPLLGELLAGAIAVARQHDGSRELALGGLRKPDVQEARAADLDGLDAGLHAQMHGDRLSDLARWPRCELREPHRRIGRVIAVLTVLRPLHRDVDIGDLAHLRRQRAGVNRGVYRSSDGVHDVGGSHRSRLSRCDEVDLAHKPAGNAYDGGGVGSLPVTPYSIAIS